LQFDVRKARDVYNRDFLLFEVFELKGKQLVREWKRLFIEELQNMY
jgi:hypothetical protein